MSNAAGVIPHLLGSFQYLSSAGVVISPAGSIDIWLSIYGAALGGWFLVIVVPMLWQLGFEVVLQFRMRRYEEARSALAE